MNDSRLKIGFLGASRGIDFAKVIGKDYPFARVAAVCESYPVLREKTAAFFDGCGMQAEMYDDFDTMLDESGIDAVVIANYANEHAPYAIRALKKGIHVLSEVMPVQNPAEAAALCDAVEESGRIYAYAENYCFFDPCFMMREMVDAGDIGEVYAMEGTFINDCSPKWDLLTRGVRDHWRNYVPSTFYCSHSIGPMMYATGTRAVRVNGAEMPRAGYMAREGARSGSAAMELMEMNTGAMARSMNGNLRRPYQAAYRLLGEDGTIECDQDSIRLFRYHSGFEYDITTPKPAPRDFPFRPKGELGTINNSNPAVIGRFVGAILGDDECRKYTIDVYRALDMALPGLMAYRSILAGGAPMPVPDFRDRKVRETYRNDFACTDPRMPEKFRLPTSKNGTPEVDEAVYERVSNTFLGVDLTPGMK